MNIYSGIVINGPLISPIILHGTIMIQSRFEINKATDFIPHIKKHLPGVFAHHMTLLDESDNEVITTTHAFVNETLEFLYIHAVGHRDECDDYKGKIPLYVND